VARRRWPGGLPLPWAFAIGGAAVAYLLLWAALRTALALPAGAEGPALVPAGGTVAGP
jgi:hypothetical protein